MKIRRALITILGAAHTKIMAYSKNVVEVKIVNNRNIEEVASEITYNSELFGDEIVNVTSDLTSLVNDANRFHTRMYGTVSNWWGRDVEVVAEPDFYRTQWSTSEKELPKGPAQIIQFNRDPERMNMIATQYQQINREGRNFVNNQDMTLRYAEMFTQGQEMKSAEEVDAYMAQPHARPVIMSEANIPMSDISHMDKEQLAAMGDKEPEVMILGKHDTIVGAPVPLHEYLEATKMDSLDQMIEEVNTGKRSILSQAFPEALYERVKSGEDTLEIAVTGVHCNDAMFQVNRDSSLSIYNMIDRDNITWEELSFSGEEFVREAEAHEQLHDMNPHHDEAEIEEAERTLGGDSWGPFEY